jgi:hypothetical protein
MLNRSNYLLNKENNEWKDKFELMEEEYKIKI